MRQLAFDDGYHCEYNVAQLFERVNEILERYMFTARNVFVQIVSNNQQSSFDFLHVVFVGTLHDFVKIFFHSDKVAALHMYGSYGGGFVHVSNSVQTKVTELCFLFLNM